MNDSGFSDNARIREEVQAIQEELHEAVTSLLKEASNKLSQKDLALIQDELNELEILLERMKEGLVWVALFGKTSVGKSAVVNSLLNEDVATVGVEHDCTREETGYRKDPWVISDLPGFMGNPKLEELALKEASRAHGHIFILNGEPHEDELEMFEIIYEACPKTPKIVLVNKFDAITWSHTEDEIATIKMKIYEKMRKYVASDKDIIYGNAVSIQEGKRVRQPLPELMDRLYEGAGTLGMVVNILDPAGRANDITSSIHDKIKEVRLKIGRKVGSAFALTEVSSALIPFNTLLVTPGILGSMTYVLCKVMGKKVTKADSKSLFIEIIKSAGSVLAGDFVVVATIEQGLNLLTAAFGPVGFIIGALGNVGGLGWWRYRRTVILAEIVMEYASRGFSWGAEDRASIIRSCKDRALKFHKEFKGVN